METLNNSNKVPNRKREAVMVYKQIPRGVLYYLYIQYYFLWRVFVLNLFRRV